ncbi:MAG: 3-dehydroquinate synthase [Bacilli bacterium]|nr:3-dehydroquinate synthase [Bacilli bacterium]
MVIQINIPGNEYEILIERGAIQDVKSYILDERKILVVTDDGVPSIYADAVVSQFSHAYKLVIKQGDANKNLRQYEDVLNALSQHAFTRSDVLIAVGGGMVGDLAGFAAATYMRGIDFYNIPTTLLSQVDSSIGGKVAVNLSGIKNTVGAFYHPKRVFIDPDTLNTLDQRLFNEGLVEVIKMAATNDARLFEDIEHCQDAKSNIEDIIARALLIKKAVVESDPKEKGPRMVLNFGHTVGHAIETLGKGKYYHGEAVAMGMLYTSDNEAKTRIENLLSRLGLPLKDEFSTPELMGVIAHDKKAKSGGVTLCLVDQIGSSKLVSTPLEEIEQRIARRKKA